MVRYLIILAALSILLVRNGEALQDALAKEFTCTSGFDRFTEDLAKGRALDKIYDIITTLPETVKR